MSKRRSRVLSIALVPVASLLFSASAAAATPAFDEWAIDFATGSITSTGSWG
ncbi:MAG: hypothetical protein GXP10_04710, partial [Gammaproteobacteria bacterium]|nr:hypothetical protein [Gammaproteobacteria bacterium]